MFKRILSLALAVAVVLGLTAVGPAATAATGGKLVALTFDDGPGPYTDRLLDGLAERGVKVTFFMVGSNVANYPETVERVYNEGHQVANHSYSHPDLTGLSDSQVVSQISRTNDLLDLACGSGTDYLVRAPYGSTNGRVRSLVGAPLIYWSVDPQDWKYRDATTVKNHIVNYATDGAIILLHDIHSTSVDGALAAIDVLQQQGYEFVTVRELFRRRGVELENGTTYVKCSPTGTDQGPVEAPTITGAASGGKLQVTLTAQEGTKIYYTTDGSAINGESRLYTGPFTVETPCTVKAAAAYNLNGDRSRTVETQFTIPAAREPQLTVEEGVLTLRCETQGAELYYRLNGGEPTKYEGPVTLTPGTTIVAWASGARLLTSREVRATWSHLGNFFRDVFPNAWYYEVMDQAASLGYMEGLGNGTFCPMDSVTRAQLVTLLYRYSGETAPEDRTCPFADVSATAWYTEAISWASSVGIVNGYQDGTFLPNQSITRQEMCKVFAQYLTHTGNILPGEQACTYEDRDSISQWALAYVESMSACGMFEGDDHNRFNPHDNGTRAQAATVLMRLAGVEEALPDVPQEPEEKPADPTEP